ncbi:MAG: ribonucleoside-diphosphate reductase, adenosylcobalamin-dependent [Nitrospirae bacterium RBG_16_43_11]|nr:MAG: ribonucleoside-diphosphate reductase, adenosylcobalamin-dependent [Nitrospirae bacterium RBG_16_43_11]
MPTKEISEPLFSQNAIKVLEKRYLAKNDKGQVVETPKDMFRRVARNIAQAELIYDGTADLARAEEKFYQLMVKKEFLPNSPTLMNAGRELQQLSACFVLPIEDSMEGIFESVKQAAIIHKSGGGTGFSFSRLRPKNDVVRTTGGVASGPISFMKVFNHATEAVKQGGTRRGANMGILRVDHPDILEFIDCKINENDVTNFNISVAITDRFMEAVVKDEPYDLLSPRTGQPASKLSAREVFDKIANNAWKNGEPGLFFIDTTNRANPTPHAGSIEATNPCGEQPLIPYESCNLGSINLEVHVTHMDGKAVVDWDRLERTVRTSVHFLDNVIDMNHYPITQIGEVTKSNRKIGLGLMGFARMLFKLGLAYDSLEGIDSARSVMQFIRDIGHSESERMAEKRGVFPNWEGSVYKKQGKRLRNAYITTVAPTGTLSMIADTSGGCEPEFSLIWYKNVMGGEHLPYVQETFIDIAKAEGFWSDDLINKIIANHGSVRGLNEVPAKWQDIFATAHDVASEWHVRMQAAFQEYTDSAVSKTINMPLGATVDDVKDAYILAYKLGCKGITVYRDGSRSEQVMNVGKSQGKAKEAVSSKQSVVSSQKSEKEQELDFLLPRQEERKDSRPSHPLIEPRPRPKTTTGVTNKMRTSCGDLYVTVNEDENGRPFEVFCNMGKAGGCEGSQNEAIGRLISLAFRSGVSPQSVIRQLIGIRCNQPYGLGKNIIHSCSDAISKAVLEYMISKQGEVNKELSVEYDRRIGAACPDCGCEMEFSEGCEKCHFCGHSKCY